MRDWLSHSIPSSKAMVVAKALLWTSFASASWISADESPLSPCGILLCVGCVV